MTSINTMCDPKLAPEAKKKNNFVTGSIGSTGKI